MLNDESAGHAPITSFAAVAGALENNPMVLMARTDGLLAYA